MTIASNANHPVRNINDNTISDLVASNTTVNSVNIVRGIQISGAFPTAAQWNYSGNKVFNLISGDEFSTAANVVLGMDLIASTGTVERNLIYNLTPRTTATTSSAYAYGLRATGSNALANGTTTGSIFKNNIIRLGVGVTNDCVITAFYQAAATDVSHLVKIYNNTLYVGGTAISTATKNTFGFFHTGIAAKNDLKNNIIANKRAVGNTEAHYAMQTTTLLEIASSDYNMYQFGKYFGNTEAANVEDLATWAQSFSTTTSIFDAHSSVADPKFVAPNADVPNMNLQETSPAKGTGIALADVTTDFNGFARTTMDIGALAYGSISGVKQTIENELSVYTTKNNIVVNNQLGQTARVYSLSGQLVKTAVLQSDKENISVNKGFYIVRINSLVSKVLVK